MRERIKACRSCRLCDNQPPMVQEIKTRPRVMFTGLSAVSSSRVDLDEPFSAATRSGQLMRELEVYLGSAACYYTNLVKCLPLHSNGKIRYPTTAELEACFENYQLEVDSLLPRKIVLLGRQVADFVTRKLGLEFVSSAERGFGFRRASTAKTEYLAAHHPSYILIYKRRRIEEYKRGLRAFVES